MLWVVRRREQVIFHEKCLQSTAKEWMVPWFYFIFIHSLGVDWDFSYENLPVPHSLHFIKNYKHVSESLLVVSSDSETMCLQFYKVKENGLLPRSTSLYTLSTTPSSLGEWVVTETRKVWRVVKERESVPVSTFPDHFLMKKWRLRLGRSVPHGLAAIKDCLRARLRLEGVRRPLGAGSTVAPSHLPFTLFFKKSGLTP